MNSSNLLETINSSHHVGTFNDRIDLEDQRELIRLLGSTIDADDSLYQLRLNPLSRPREAVEASFADLFGPSVRRPEMKRKKAKAQKERLSFECLDAYDIVLRAQESDPATQADGHILEECQCGDGEQCQICVTSKDLMDLSPRSYEVVHRRRGFLGDEELEIKMELSIAHELGFI